MTLVLECWTIYIKEALMDNAPVVQTVEATRCVFFSLYVLIFSVEESPRLRP